MPSAAEANRIAARYRQLGFRVAVLPARVDGRTMHRVAVGQFDSLGEARGARALLPDDAPPDAWILRF